MLSFNDRFAARLVAWMCLALGLWVAAGCESSPRAAQQAPLQGGAAPRPAAINHIAFFKLKNPGDAAELIADCDHSLGRLPGVVSYFCGRPLNTGRTNVDSDFDVGFYVGFASEADYSAYVAHPNHKALVAKWQPRWQSIHILDVSDPTP